jgi:hypothetical protein
MQEDNKQELHGKNTEMELPILSPPIFGSKIAEGSEETSRSVTTQQIASRNVERLQPTPSQPALPTQYAKRHSDVKSKSNTASRSQSIPEYRNPIRWPTTDGPMQETRCLSNSTSDKTDHRQILANLAQPPLLSSKQNASVEVK